MRLAFILGFLVGGGVASLLAQQSEEGDVLETAKVAGTEAADAASAQVNPVLDRIKHQIDDAKDAAREAQLAKEAEMLRTYEAMINRKDSPAL